MQQAPSIIDYGNRLRRQAYALEPGGEKRLILAWKGGWNQVAVFLDGRAVGVIADKEAMSAGREFVLPDGSALQVQLGRKYGLRVSRNGQLLAGAASQASGHQLAYGTIYFIGIVSLVLGAAAVLWRVATLEEAGIGALTLIIGVVYLVLGYLVQRRSLAALILAIAIYALDSLMVVAAAISSGSVWLLPSILPRIITAIPIIQGIAPSRPSRGRRHRADAQARASDTAAEQFGGRQRQVDAPRLAWYPGR